MRPRAPSIDTLAQTLGLSRTTVSDALRGKGRVSAATVQRVRRAAQSAGYRPNPLMAAVLGSINRRRSPGSRGAIAVIDLHEAGHWPHGPFSRALVTGARERAADLGFTVAEFVVGAELSGERLDGILQSRGIHGVMVLPAWSEPDVAGFDWSRYSGIYTDVSARLRLHSVCSDHYGSMLSLLERLAERGYRRPGLVLQRGRDERIYHRQSAAFSAFHAGEGRGEGVPPLITVDAPHFATEVEPWLRRYRPDVVLSHFSETPSWLRACPLAAGSGFVLLNVLHRTAPCAALDLQPAILGGRAIELLVGQMLRNEFGFPSWPSRTTVEARWVEGPTVRPAIATPRAAETISVGGV